MSAQDLTTKADELVEEFALFDDWMDRYQYLIDLGKELEPLDEAFRTDDYRIHGCQSQVWLQPVPGTGTVSFKADSDAQITKGLIAILLRVVNGQPPALVAGTDLAFLDQIELKEHLSPTRKNGLDSMIRQIRLYAGALAAQSTRTDDN
ncbi:MAG: SufE family protein [Bacteroidetes bacterium]|nr:SufE family protein [Bacteroidota bacterium]